MSANSEDQPFEESAAQQDSAGREAPSNALSAGRVGRAHGLDGSFYVTGPKPRLLILGAIVKVDGRGVKIVRRAGTDEHPLIRLQSIEGRGAVEALRGQELTVDFAEAPELEDGEWWAGELEGCEVFDGERRVGTVLRMVELPSCEALEVRLAGQSQDKHSSGASELLVPMVRDAIRGVDSAARRIDVDMGFLGEPL
ncbi:MAG: ribosome maturation factor RimM [Solirubrobacteraceae bacterium]